jgi:hypothetical protein
MAKGKKSGSKNAGGPKKQKPQSNTVEPKTPVSPPVIPSITPQVSLKVADKLLDDEDGRPVAKLVDFKNFFASKVPSGNDMSLDIFKSYGPVKKLIDDGLVEGVHIYLSLESIIFLCKIKLFLLIYLIIYLFLKMTIYYHFGYQQSEMLKV